METNINAITLRELWQKSNETHKIQVVGTSMLPLLHEGDEILVSHDLIKINRGDILVYTNSKGLVAHRIVRIKKQNQQPIIITTKGDNCSYFDLPVSETEALGVVTAIIKNDELCDFSTHMWQMKNYLMGIYQLLLGTSIQPLRNLKHIFRKQSN